jgi:cytochrome P450
MAPIVRDHAGRILDGLPRNEIFDWVDPVSVELTTQMLAILMDFPFEERRKLTHWSNVATTSAGAPDAVVRPAPIRSPLMARRPSPPAEPQRAALTADQMKRGIPRIQRHVEELEAFDP